MEIKPLKSFVKTVVPAPDKSITHRAIMFNSIAAGKAKITNALLGNDCVSTIDCMRKLGAHIETDGNTVTVEGRENLVSANLDVGNSGTTFRLLCGLLSGREGDFTLDGDSSIRSRPMKRVIDPLSLMGADIVGTEGGRAPVAIHGRKLRGISYKMPVASAQVKSAILLAGLSAEGITCVHEKIRSRNHTELMLKAMGAGVDVKNYRHEVEPRGDVTVTADALRPFFIGAADVPSLIDELPLLAVVACFAKGDSEVRGATELRVKESDRIKTTAETVRALGGKITELPDGFVIHGEGGLIGGKVHSHGDHRIAMSAAIGGLGSREGCEIEGADSAAVSYPSFWEDIC